MRFPSRPVRHFRRPGRFPASKRPRSQRANPLARLRGCVRRRVLPCLASTGCGCQPVTGRSPAGCLSSRLRKYRVGMITCLMEPHPMARKLLPRHLVHLTRQNREAVYWCLPASCSRAQMLSKTGYPAFSGKRIECTWQVGTAVTAMAPLADGSRARKCARKRVEAVARDSTGKPRRCIIFARADSKILRLRVWRQSFPIGCSSAAQPAAGRDPCCEHLGSAPSS